MPPTMLRWYQKKTKLLAFSGVGHAQLLKLAEVVNPISISGKQIFFSESAEHVGILRSTAGGNMPHILARLAAHRRAVHGVFHCGLAKRNRGNPAAGLRLERS